MGKRQNEPTLDVQLNDEERQDVREAATEFARLSLLSGTHRGLSEEALRLAFVMATPFTGASPRGWAEIAGVGHMTYYRNHDKPEFQQVLADLAQRKKARLETKADRRLEQIIDYGDDKAAIAAIRTLKEELGRFVRRVETKDVTETPEEREQRRAMQQRVAGHQDHPRTAH